MSRCFGNSKVKRCLICHLKMFIDCSVNFNFKYVGSLAISSALCFLISKRREETTKKMNVTLKKKNEKLLLKWQTVNRNRHFCLCFILHFLPFSSILPSFFFIPFFGLSSSFSSSSSSSTSPASGPPSRNERENADSNVSSSARVRNSKLRDGGSFLLSDSDFGILYIVIFRRNRRQSQLSSAPPPPLPPSPPPFTHINKNSINFQLEFDFKPISDGFFFFVWFEKVIGENRQHFQIQNLLNW